MVNGVVNNVAMNAVKTAVYRYFSGLEFGVRGFKSCHSHMIPKIAANDN